MDSMPPPPQVSPSVPWQVRWKRPQFNKVIVGIDEDTSIDCNTTSSNDIKNSTNDDLYEELQVDEINKQWTPISNSSIVLTRKEAKTVIYELSKRDKLLIRRRKRKGAHDVNNHLSSANDGKSSSGYEKVTPKNKNTKSSVSRRESAGTTLPVNNDKTSKSSMSNWFKSITSPSSYTNNNSTTTSLGGKPPRAKTPTTTSDTTTKQQKQSQLSPTGKTFTTFNVKTPPPNPLPNFADSSQQQGNNMYDSPPDDNDDCQVSTASSLLWEDMTLTSVSEEDALHYGAHHRYQRKQQGRETVTEVQQRQQATDKDDGSTDSSKRRLFNSTTAAPKSTRDELGGGRYYYDRQGNLRLSDWDGYDNVVLSTTIYSTGSSTDTDNGRGRSSGEVVVMELLSTKNPPSCTSPKTEGAKSTTTVKNKGGKKKVVEEHLKLSSSDSSSHASSPASTKGDQSKTISSDDASTNSTSTTTNTKHYSDEEEDEGTSNHTRMLTRRVLYWPTYINNDKNKLSDCPSFVSLGRTNIWKERKTHDIDEPLASARVAEEEDEQDVRSQPQESGNTLLGNICGPLFDNDESDEAEESSENDEQAEKRKDHEQQNDTLPDSSNEERVADAMEVYRSLNFLFGGSSDTLLPSSSKKPTSTSTKKTRKIDVAPRHYPIPIKKKKKLTQPLSLCLVTSNGTVHFFHALRVLLSGGKTSSKSSRSSSTGSEDLSNSFASLFMGSNLFTKVNDSVMPLSHPRASLQLSQLVPNSRPRKEEERMNHDNGDPSTWQKFILQQQETDEPHEQTSSRGNDWSRLNTFDASIDPTTLPLRTILQSNVLTGSCVTSDTSNSYLAICGKGLRRIIHKSKDENNRRHTSHVLGGYVTFISLRYNTESRSIYVPFAPESIQQVYWMGMHFVVLLGVEGRVTTEGGKGRQQRRPYAMAIRVDCCQGDPLLSSSISSTPSRFQCITITLPSINESLGVLHLSQLLATSGSLQQLDCVETRAVSVSSIPSSPPGIILSFRVGPALVVVNHTLIPFQTEGFGKKQIILSTLVRPGHRALLNVSKSDATASKSGNVWCVGGQGWSLAGVQGGQKANFICWDGATDDTQGPYILPFESSTNEEQCLSSVVTPLMSYVKYAEKVAESSHSKADNNLSNTTTKSSFRLPSFLLQQNEAEGDFSSAGFTMPKRSLSSTLKESIKVAAIIEGGVDEIIINALDSISSVNHKSPKSSGIGGNRSNRTKSLAMSHQEKSKRLLRQCSSWTQLDDTKANRGIVNGQGESDLSQMIHYLAEPLLNTLSIFF